MLFCLFFCLSCIRWNEWSVCSLSREIPVVVWVTVFPSLCLEVSLSLSRRQVSLKLWRRRESEIHSPGIQWWAWWGRKYTRKKRDEKFITRMRMLMSIFFVYQRKWVDAKAYDWFLWLSHVWRLQRYTIYCLCHLIRLPYMTSINELKFTMCMPSKRL